MSYNSKLTPGDSALEKAERSLITKTVVTRTIDYYLISDSKPLR